MIATPDVIGDSGFALSSTMNGLVSYLLKVTLFSSMPDRLSTDSGDLSIEGSNLFSFSADENSFIKLY